MVVKEGGSFINKYYNSSLQKGIDVRSCVLLTIWKALQAVCPDYVPTAKPQGYWKDKQNQKEFFDQLAIKWNIQKPEDWNNVTYKMVLNEQGGNFIKAYYNGSLQQGNNGDVQAIATSVHFKIK